RLLLRVCGVVGFVGSHVVYRMLAEGHRVTVLDNLSTGSRDRLAHHRGDPGLAIVEGDLLDVPGLEEATAGHDLVWHLAANTDIPGGARKTEIDLKQCVVATWHVLEA